MSMALRSIPSAAAAARIASQNLAAGASRYLVPCHAPETSTRRPVPSSRPLRFLMSWVWRKASSLSLMPTHRKNRLWVCALRVVIVTFSAPFASGTRRDKSAGAARRLPMACSRWRGGSDGRDRACGGDQTLEFLRWGHPLGTLPGRGGGSGGDSEAGGLAEELSTGQVVGQRSAERVACTR